MGLMILGGPVSARAEIITNMPLPPIGDIMPQVLKKADGEDDNGRKFNERYHFERTRITEVRNTDGEVKKRKEKVKTNDGRPPTTTPAATSVAVTNYTTTDSTADAGTKASNNGKSADPDVRSMKKSDFPLTRDLLARFDFTVIGHEKMNNRLMLVVDFQPVKGKKPEHDLKDKFINKAAGRLWIDLEDYAIARARVLLMDRVNVVGGLAGSVAKFTCDMQRERTPDGLWFMRTSNWHLEGREFIFPLVVDYHEELRDLRPLAF
jgi:hypothetical protein